MKHTITFNLPDEQEQLELALNAHKLNLAMYAYIDWLRSQVKYIEPGLKLDTLEEARDKFYEMLQSYGAEII